MVDTPEAAGAVNRIEDDMAVVQSEQDLRRQRNPPRFGVQVGGD